MGVLVEGVGVAVLEPLGLFGLLADETTSMMARFR